MNRPLSQSVPQTWSRDIGGSSFISLVVSLFEVEYARGLVECEPGYAEHEGSFRVVFSAHRDLSRIGRVQPVEAAQQRRPLEQSVALARGAGLAEQRSGICARLVLKGYLGVGKTDRRVL